MAVSSRELKTELLNCSLYRLNMDHPQKTHQLLSNGYSYHVLLLGMSTHALPSSGHPIVAHSLLRSVFTGLLPSNALQYPTKGPSYKRGLLKNVTF
jgi:hypothetical protein